MAAITCLIWDLDGTLWQGVILEDRQVTVSDEIRDSKTITGWTWPGVTIMPTRAVKTTSDMTRGFSSAK